MKRAAVAVVVGLFALTFMATGMGAAANGTAGAYPCSAPVNIPAAPDGKAFTHAQLAKLWVAAGGPASAANVAAAIALAESGGNPANVNTSLGGPNVGPTGLWQIYGNPLPGNALDPLTNARMAVKKWQDAGISFRPWTTYTGADTGPNGGPGPKTYLRYLDKTTAANPEGAIVECGAPINLGHLMGPFHIVPIPWAPGEECAAEILPAVTQLHRQYGVGVSDCYDRDHSAGHQSPGHNITGTAVDFTGPDAAMDRVAQWAVSKGLTVYYDGRFGTTRLAGHGPSYVAGSNAHVHVEFAATG
jgi:hypothetical protein